MEYIGKYGEHLTLLNLLQRDIEAYLAIKSNQEDYDITVVLNSNTVKRVQVKSTELQNKNTNNSITGTKKEYDYLVLVIVEEGENRTFILTREEVNAERSTDVVFSCSRKGTDKYIIKESLIKYENLWDKIKTV